MKMLRFHELKNDDYLCFSFTGGFDWQADWENELGPFFQALETYAGEWMPGIVKGKRQRKYTRASIWKGLEEDREERGASIGLYRTAWPALDMTFRLWFPPLEPEVNVTIRARPLTFFAEAERCRLFIELVRAWAFRYPVTHVDAHSSDDAELAGSPDFGRDDKTWFRDGFDKIYEVSWLNVYGPKLVESVGRERMLSTPAWLVEELPNGAILLVLGPVLADFWRDEARVAQARAHVHLRPDLDFDTVLRALRERSATLAPVEPRFPPELAPLLTRIIEATSSHIRQRRIAEFNAWHPPEPEEWLPAVACLPSDVDDEEGARKHYRYLAEHLVALLHKKVPSVFDATPDSLPEVDFHFYREAFPRIFERERIDTLAVPAIGAYLGEVLVRHLGGQWIPRQKLEESQVRVGTRVWLPFVRAWNYMRTCQSLLDSSLTQLYRAAERHR